MRELERELRELGGAIEFPETPDLAPAVRARIASVRRERVFPWRRTLAIALATLVTAIAAAMAVPSARTAILEWLGLRGVSIERVPEAPKPPLGGELLLGERTTLAGARAAASFRVRVPALAAYRKPDEVYFSREYASGGYVSFVYGSGERVALLITQFRARIADEFIQKLVGPGTTVERVRVNGGRGYWLAGEPHSVLYVDENGVAIPESSRLATRTLLWQLGAVTYRLEGDVTKAEALRIARSMR